MRKKILVLLVAAVTVAGLGLLLVRAQQAPASQVAIGGKGANMPLAKLTGESASLHDFAGARGTLVIFVATRCPVSNDYNQRMAEVAHAAASLGFVVIGVNANRSEPAEEVARHASEHGLDFTILKDPDNRLADYLGGSVTPEAYVFDPGWTLRYHGRIDDSRNPANITTRDLRAALEALAAGKSVAVTETKAFGCTIKRVPRS